MTKTQHFLRRAAADKFAAGLSARGVYDPSVYPAKTWGPRGCFHVPFSGWNVVWLEEVSTPK